MIVNPEAPYQPSPLFNGAGWTVDYGPQRKDPPEVYKGMEILVHASSWVSAQRALDLIHGCHQLVRGDPNLFDIHLIAHNAKEPDWMELEQRRELVDNTYSTVDLPLACAVAAKASRRRHWVYAVAKYKFSLWLYSVHHMDMEPHFMPHLSVSKFPGDHVLFCHAIISAFAAIEDLGLNVPAGHGRPSRIGDDWNPEVKADLERRLRAAGVDLVEKFLWTVRGPRRKIEKSRPVPSLSKARWSVGPVRDCEVHITDAIAYASWLRDRVAAHTVKDLTRVLSPYDVVNVQDVARRLLLEALGFWRWHEKERVRTRHCRATSGSARRGTRSA